MMLKEFRHYCADGRTHWMDFVRGREVQLNIQWKGF